jgi:hypothetical protein
MARYDRIARLTPPARDGAYAGWLALRDLEGQERDTDLGRRARLRFLAVRLVHRLTGLGDGADSASLRLQGDAVREELGQLPSRDPERQRLATFLRSVSSLGYEDIVTATLDLARGALEDGHTYAAEEFYLAAKDLATERGLDDLATRASKGLSGIGSARS